MAIIVFMLMLASMLSVTPVQDAAKSVGTTAINNKEAIETMGDAIYQATVSAVKLKVMQDKAKEYADTEYSAAELAAFLHMDEQLVRVLYDMYALDQGYEPSAKSVTELVEALRRLSQNQVLAKYMGSDIKNALSKVDGMDLGFLSMFTLSYKDVASLAGMDEYLVKLAFTIDERREDNSKVRLGDLAVYLIDNSDKLASKFGFDIGAMDETTLSMLQMIAEN